MTSVQEKSWVRGTERIFLLILVYNALVMSGHAVDVLNYSSDVTLVYNNNIKAPVNSSPGMQISSVEATDKQAYLLTDKQASIGLRVINSISYIILVVSLPLTACNVIVFLHKSMRSATSSYVVTLSLAQVLYLIISVGLSVFDTVMEDRLTNLIYLVFVIYFGIFLSLVIKRGSNIVMCLISLERLYAIARPLHIKSFLLVRHPVPILVAAYGTTLLWNVNLPLRVQIVNDSNNTRQAVFKSTETALYLSHSEIFNTVGLLAEIILNYLALVMQIVFNSLTIWAMRRHTLSSTHIQCSRDDEKSMRRERQLTVTILGAAVAYVILSLPFAVHGLCATVIPEYNVFRKYQNLSQVIGSAGLNLTHLSCISQFVCFFILSSRFRKTLRRVFALHSVIRYFARENQTKIETLASVEN